MHFKRVVFPIPFGPRIDKICPASNEKVLEMYAGTRTPSMEPQWLAAGLSQYTAANMIVFNTVLVNIQKDLS